jgi:hypothetical protein
MNAPALAKGWLEQQPAWSWELRKDVLGIYRWYLTDEVPTRICGATRGEAEIALRAFGSRYLDANVVISAGQT